MMVFLMILLVFLSTMFVPLLVFSVVVSRYPRPAEAMPEALQLKFIREAIFCLILSAGILAVMAALYFSHTYHIFYSLLASGVCLIFVLVVAAQGIKRAKAASMGKGYSVLQFLIGLASQIGFAGALIHVVDSMHGLGWGRPLRLAGKVVKPDLCDGEQWAQGAHADRGDLDAATCRALEALWLHDAKKEYASVPAFNRIGWQLAAVAAPPELLRDVSIATLQEIEHTRKCFAMAASFGSTSQTVMPMPELLGASFHIEGNPFVHLAVESLSDGCMLEGFNADTAHHSTFICTDPASLQLIRQIAREESAHAELSWRILEFCLRQDPQPVSVALRAEMEQITRSARPTAASSEHLPLVQAADKDALKRFGRLPDTEFDGLWRARMDDTRERLSLLCEEVEGTPAAPSMPWAVLAAGKAARSPSVALGRH